MPIKILSAEELARRTKTTGPAAALAEQLAKLEPGMGGVLSTTEEKVSRQTLKNRLRKASEVSGVPIKFLKSGSSEVLFQVAVASPPKRRRGRPPKSAKA